jgi:hypothetical protein
LSRGSTRESRTPTGRTKSSCHGLNNWLVAFETAVN